jgi:hypothetical protein
LKGARGYEKGHVSYSQRRRMNRFYFWNAQKRMGGESSSWKTNDQTWISNEHSGRYWQEGYKTEKFR